MTRFPYLFSADTVDQDKDLSLFLAKTQHTLCDSTETSTLCEALGTKDGDDALCDAIVGLDDLSDQRSALHNWIAHIQNAATVDQNLLKLVSLGSGNGSALNDFMTKSKEQECHPLTCQNMQNSDGTFTAFDKSQNLTLAVMTM